ncbi:MAG: hypothetical protein LAP85_19855 [Acidobacteriia bacterium]|nr:hypothetical protein [Terriglobia bacterium]
MSTARDTCSWLLWIALILQGLVFISTTPVWEGFDEPFHYAYIQHLAENGALPVYGKSMLSREVTRSFEIGPISNALNSILGGHYTTFAALSQLSDVERRERAQDLRDIREKERMLPDTQHPISNYEAHHAPLYYLIAVPVYRMCSSLDLPSRVFCLRLFSLLIGSLTLVAAHAAARRALPGRVESRTLAFVIALMPMFIATIARISNDALAVPLGSLVVFLVIDYFAHIPSGGRALQIGIALGLGLLTKAYFLAVMAGAVAVFAVAVCTSADRKRLLRHIAIILILAAGISSWWYVRNYLLYGNLSGMQELTLTANLSLADRFAMASKVPWLAAWHGMIKQHIWLGNMSLMEFSRAIYNFGYLLVFLAVLGLLGRGVSAIRRFCRRHARASSIALINGEELRRQDRSLAIAFLFYSFFLMAAAYHMWQNFILVRVPGGTGGYYLYAAIVPELLLLVYGLKALPWKTGKIAQAATIGYVVVINFVAYFCKTIPYYGGFSIARFHLGNLFELYSPATFTLILSRLARQQASWIGSKTILALLLCHLVCMTIVTWIVVANLGESRTSPQNGIPEPGSIPA